MRAADVKFAQDLVEFDRVHPGVVKELELQRAIVVCGIAEVEALPRHQPRSLSVARAEELGYLLSVPARCELCGEPAGEGGALCPACAVSR